MSSRRFVLTLCVLAAGIFLCFGFRHLSVVKSVLSDHPLPPSASEYTCKLPWDLNTPYFQKVLRSLARKSGYDQELVALTLVGVQAHLQDAGKEVSAYQIACDLEALMPSVPRNDDERNLAQVEAKYIERNAPSH